MELVGSPGNASFGGRANGSRAGSLDSASLESSLAALRNELTTFELSESDVALLRDVLEKVEPMARLPTVLKELAILAFERVDVPRKAKVTTAGDPANRFYVVGSGKFETVSPEVRPLCRAL
jgi:CRP-like cAMP-binding protein